MNLSLRSRAIFVLIVILATSAFAWYPPLADRLGIGGPGFLMNRRLTLGLDLRGGVQFVLKVNVDDALRAGVDVPRDEIVEQAKQAVDRRINELGVVEPVIAVQGADRDELAVQLPGFTDVTRARKVLGTTARLDWKIVVAGPESQRETLMPGGTPPDGTEIIATTATPQQYYLLGTAADVNGREIRHARAIQDENGLPAVAFTLSPEGGRRFADLTRSNVGRQLAIVLDGRVHSAPEIEEPITGGEGRITGGFTLREATDLALVLRSGALPVSMTFISGEYVGPTLGLQSIRAGIAASLAGIVFVASFMLVYYRRAGINAFWSVLANLVMLLGLLASVGAALTLPGIAGLILTIGIGVDSNVLIFERIKEELRAGRSPAAAVRAGFSRVFLTILDTHVASLVAALFLFQFGTGAIRGFATTLTLGLLSNVFTAVVVSRTLFHLTLARSRRLTGSTPLSGLTSARRSPRSVDFMSWRKYALALSTAVIISGLGLILTRGGLPLGIDFTGGTSVVARFATPVHEDDIRRALPGDESVQRFGQQPDRSMLIRLPHIAAEDGTSDLETGVNAIRTSLVAARTPAFEIAGSTMVGPAFGRDLQRKGVFATVASLAGISAYIALRFRPSFAAGALVATAHDIAVTVTLLCAAGYDFTLSTVAAILTIAGYSVNDTIVIFDRVRENVRGAHGLPMGAVINLAINQTLGRTVITAGTTFLAVLALFLFGGDALRGFSFAMLVGIATGTYSTVFIAAPVAARFARHRPA